MKEGSEEKEKGNWHSKSITHTDGNEVQDAPEPEPGCTGVQAISGFWIWVTCQTVYFSFFLMVIFFVPGRERALQEGKIISDSDFYRKKLVNYHLHSKQMELLTLLTSVFTIFVTNLTV